MNLYDEFGTTTLARQATDDDVYVRQVGTQRALIVVPGIWSTMPPELLALVRARRAASLTGRCPICAVEPEPHNGALAMRHETFCEVTDEHLGPKLAAWSRQVGRYARGRRITEIPGT